MIGVIMPDLQFLGFGKRFSVYHIIFIELAFPPFFIRYLNKIYFKGYI